jgi:coproporphyrinogen III oxidase
MTIHPARITRRRAEIVEFNLVFIAAMNFGLNKSVNCCESIRLNSKKFVKGSPFFRVF